MICHNILPLTEAKANPLKKKYWKALWWRKISFPLFFLVLYWESYNMRQINSMHSCVYAWLSHFSHVWPFATLWTIALQAPLSMTFSRQEYWSGLPCPSSAYLPDSAIEPSSLMSPALAGRFYTTSDTWEAPPNTSRRPQTPEGTGKIST